MQKNRSYKITSFIYTYTPCSVLNGYVMTTEVQIFFVSQNQNPNCYRISQILLFDYLWSIFNPNLAFFLLVDLFV